jgi:uncharacterized protein YifN (PemK superfamily)
MSLNAFFTNLAKDKGTTNFVLYDDHAASPSDLRKGHFTKMQRRNSCPWSRRSSAEKFSALECSQPLAIPTRKRSNAKLNGGRHHQVVEKVNTSTSECSQPPAVPTRKRSNDKLNRGYHHQVVEEVNKSDSECSQPQASPTRKRSNDKLNRGYHHQVVEEVNKSDSECSQPQASPTRKRSNDKLNRGYHHQVVEKVNKSTSESKISSRMLLALYDEVKAPSTSKVHKNRSNRPLLPRLIKAGLLKESQ